jgi:hypothetical protein
VGVAAGDVGDLGEQAVARGGRLEAQVEEQVVGDVQVVLGRLVAGVGHVLDLGAGEVGDLAGQVAHAVRLGHLVEDLHPLAALRRVLQRQLHAAHRVADVDEGARLAAGAVHGEGVADRGLHQEAVEHGAVVAVVVEAVDEALVAQRLRVLVPHTMPWWRSVMRRPSFLA